MNGASDAVLLARVAGSLLAVVALALLVARFARRTGGRRGAGTLQVCERVGLTRDTAAVVLEAGGRRLLVGVGPAQITLLADLGAALGHDDSHDDGPGSGPAWAAWPAMLARAARTRGSSGSAVRVSSLDSLEAMLSGTPAAAVEHADAAAPDTAPPLPRRVARELDRSRRVALPPTQRGTGSVLDPRTWQQGVEALRDLTARRK